MALNFAVSYAFSPNTTISSSQVNTNTSDVANVFTGLEALTKTFAKLKVDVDPSTALEVATKQYVDHYSSWRRPVLKFGSVTTVSVESGLDGTSGDIPIVFPDGTMRTETSTTRTTFDITRNAVLITSGAQSGLTGATSEAANTWYALYAVKVTDSSSLWVTVGSTVIPVQANFSTLNTAYGVSGWVYLGMILNGDNSGSTSDILSFIQVGNQTIFNNVAVANVSNACGARVSTGTSISTLSYTYASGTVVSSSQIPSHLPLVLFTADVGGGGGSNTVTNQAATITYGQSIGTVKLITRILAPATAGITETSGGSTSMDIFVSGFIDGVLGIGSNPLF